MYYRRLGRTDLQVSLLGVEAAELEEYSGVLSPPVQHAMPRAVNLVLTMLDAAGEVRDKGVALAREIATETANPVGQSART